MSSSGAITFQDQVSADLDALMDIDGLAIVAFWRSGSKPQVPIKGIFTSIPNVETGKYMGATKSTSYDFSFACRFKDVERMKRKDYLIIDGKKFYVALEPINNYGLTTIILNESF